MTIIVATGSALAAFALTLTILLSVIVIGIRREPADAELSRKAPSFASYIARRCLGVHVRRPDNETQRETCLIEER